MAGAPAVQLTIHYGAADPQAMNDCFHSFGVTDVTDVLVRGPRALCTARVVGKSTDRLDAVGRQGRSVLTSARHLASGEGTACVIPEPARVTRAGSGTVGPT